MTLSVQDFYRSSNGDRWQLICDTVTGRSFVRHEPNLASGGRITETEVEEFLNRTGTSSGKSRAQGLFGQTVRLVTS